MATRSPEAPTSSGLAATYYAASGGGDRVPPGSILHVKTTGTVSTLGLTTVTVVDGDLAVADRSVSLPATGERYVKVPTLEAYRDPADGLVGLTWTSVTGVTFAVLSSG